MDVEKVILNYKDQEDIIMKEEKQREKPENQNQNGNVIIQKI